MSIKKAKLIGNKGQSLVEALVAIGIFLISINAIIFLIFAAQSISVDTKINQGALDYASEGIEATRSIRNRNWNELTDGEHGLLFSGNQWIFSGASDSKNNLIRKITVTTQASDIKNIKSSITWQTETPRPQKVELVAIVANKQAAIENGGDGGDGGGTPPTGNWQNPVILGSIDVGAGNEATDIDVVDNIAYLSTQSSSKNKPDILAYNVASPSSPSLLGSLDVDAYALAGIDYNNGYVYGAATGVLPDLKIIDANNPSNLNVVSEFNVITFVNAKSVLKIGTTVYLGVQRTAISGEFFTIDATNPLVPSQKDVFEINGDVNKIAVKNNLAYVANSKDDRELFILNVANPANISQAGYLNIGGTYDATSIFVQSAARVFLGAGEILYVLDATDPLNVLILGSLDVDGIINDIYVSGNLAFLATGNGTREFQAINVSNPANPILYSYLNFPQVATGIDYQNNIVYVSVRSNDGLRIITSTP